jgi:folylpolyglutamate synthase/dihydropteroate synthase
VLNPNFKRIWRDINPSASVVEEPVIEKAINRVKAIEGAHNGMRVLVTGSFKLVGSTLFYLRSEQ